MNIIKFLNEFSSVDLNQKVSSRREMFSSLGSISKKAALAAIPLGLAATPNKASGAAMFFNHVGPLNLALTLEYLEAEFYIKALESGVLPSGRPQDVYEQISKHESAHVALLESVLGSDAVEKPEFDFTAGGAFDPFNPDNPSAYIELLSLAQAFEDTGVRAYKGQAPELMGTIYLAPALQIHSVEARHASEVRRLRADFLGIPLNENSLGWITLDNNSPGMPSATDAVYAGEDLTEQAGIELTSLDSSYTAELASQSYDEPISGQEAVDIASLFIA